MSFSIWTIGHSTRTIDEFVQLLRSFGIVLLADVRTYPGSRRYPQFNKPDLAASLTQAGVEYQHFPELGGRRRAKPDSINMAWRNEMFRGYADYMESDEFVAGIERLLALSQAASKGVGRQIVSVGPRATAIMCAEAVWWRCHRSLIADYLKAKGMTVIHIMSQEKAEEHPFTSAARIVNGKLSYRGVLDPAPQ